MADRTEREFTSQAPAGYISDFLGQGIFPYLKSFMEGQFSNIGVEDATPFTYGGDRIADFDPREKFAMDMSDAAIGSYRPYMAEASDFFRKAGDYTEASGLEGSDYIRDAYGSGLGYFDDARRASGYGEDAIGASRGEFDPSTVGRYFDPYEDQVVQQTMKDVREGLSKGDMALREQGVGSGAYGGSRGRLASSELASDVASGAAERIGALRSAGYKDALGRAMSSFEGARGRDAQAGKLFGDLGQGYGRLGSGRFGLGSSAGQGLYGIGSGTGKSLAGLGSATQGLGTQFANLQAGDINRTMGMGSLGRGRSQAELDRLYSDFVGTYNLPMTTLSNVGSVVSALGPLAGGFGYAGANAPQDYPNNTGAPFYPGNYNLGIFGAGGAAGGTGTETYGGNMPGFPGGMPGFFSMSGMPFYNYYGGGTGAGGNTTTTT